MCYALDTVMVKGKEKPTSVYELVTTLDRASKEQREICEGFSKISLLMGAREYYKADMLIDVLLNQNLPMWNKQQKKLMILKTRCQKNVEILKADPMAPPSALIDRLS